MGLFDKVFKKGHGTGPVLGVTFSSRRSRLLLVEPGPNGFQLGPGFVLSYTDNTLVGADGVISSPDGLSQDLMELLEQDALMGVRAVIGIGSNQMMIKREAGLPIFSRDEFRDQVAQGTLNVNFKIREGNAFDACYIGDQSGRAADALLVQARRDLSTAVQITAVQSGLIVAGVMPEPMAVFNSIRLSIPDALGDEGADTALVVLHIGDSASFAMSVDSKGPVAVSYGSYGLNNLISMVQDSYVSLSSEEVLDIMFGEPEPGERFKDIFSIWTEEIIKRFARAIISATTQSGVPVQVLLTGEGGVIQDINHIFSPLLQGFGATVQVDIFDPVDILQGAEAVKIRWPHEGAAYAVHLGAAAAALGREAK